MDLLLVANYQSMSKLGAVDTLVGIGLPYFASAFAIFLLRQTFMGIPKELDEAARVEGASTLQILWRVYVPLARPVYRGQHCWLSLCWYRLIFQSMPCQFSLV